MISSALDEAEIGFLAEAGYVLRVRHNTMGMRKRIDAGAAHERVPYNAIFERGGIAPMS